MRADHAKIWAENEEKIKSLLQPSKRKSVTRGEFGIPTKIIDTPRLTITDLVEKTHLTRKTVREHLSVLLKQGSVERERRAWFWLSEQLQVEKALKAVGSSMVIGNADKDVVLRSFYPGGAMTKYDKEMGQAIVGLLIKGCVETGRNDFIALKQKWLPVVFLVNAEKASELVKRECRTRV